MGRCVHHCPGRARFRLPIIRDDKAAAGRVRRLLSALDGVTGVEIRSASASVVVTYDPARIDFETISTALRRGGCLGAGGGMPAGGGLAAQAGAMFGRALFAAVLERSINRGIHSLVGRAFR